MSIRRVVATLPRRAAPFAARLTVSRRDRAAVTRAFCPCAAWVAGLSCPSSCAPIRTRHSSLPLGSTSCWVSRGSALPSRASCSLHVTVSNITTRWSVRAPLGCCFRLWSRSRFPSAASSRESTFSSADLRGGGVGVFNASTRAAGTSTRHKIYEQTSEQTKQMNEYTNGWMNGMC